MNPARWKFRLATGARSVLSKQFPYTGCHHYRNFTKLQDTYESAINEEEKSNFVEEHDYLGSIFVKKNKLWGAQTERARHSFNVGMDGSQYTMRMDLIHHLTKVKKAAALANMDLGVISQLQSGVIIEAALEILSGQIGAEHFPLAIWQIGSGTSTNMNVNEVIAHRANELLHMRDLLTASTKILPNEHVNASQSSNDAFSTAMHTSVLHLYTRQLLPCLTELIRTIYHKQNIYANEMKIGRTHMMDAVPMMVGEEFDCWANQLEHVKYVIENSLTSLLEVPLGGSAVGNAVNVPKFFDEKSVDYLSKLTHFDLAIPQNKSALIAAHDRFLVVHSSLKTLAVILFKIANDIRLLSSGPRAGINELKLAANEPGSSMIPGKINPTQCEVMTSVCIHVMAEDVAVTNACAGGQLQLNCYKPMIAHKLLSSASLLSDAMASFNTYCISSLQINSESLKNLVNNSLTFAVFLTGEIGFEETSKLLLYAEEHNISLRHANQQMGQISDDSFLKLMKQHKITWKTS